LKKLRKSWEIKALSDKFEIGLIHLAPILASLLFGVLCAFLILTSTIEVYTVTPFPEGISGSFFNACYFVILVGVGASVLYLLLKRKDRKLISLITGFALTAAIFMLSIIYLSAALSMFPIPYIDTFVLVSSLVITVLADFAIFKKGSKIGNLIILCLGGGLGAFLGFSIPTLSIVLILGFLSVYDVFAVYHGPVGKIAHSGLEQLRGLSFSFKDIQMGLGDLTFYSMLSGHMFLSFGVVSCSASIMGILFGCLLSFKILEKKGMFPGLPFPIFFGLTASFLASLL
jgi:presenilin-like A22 family membrane protease